MTAATITPTGMRPLAAVLRSLGFCRSWELAELEQLRADLLELRPLVARVAELEDALADKELANSDLQILLEMARETVERQQVEFQDAKLTRRPDAGQVTS